MFQVVEIDGNGREIGFLETSSADEAKAAFELAAKSPNVYAVDVLEDRRPFYGMANGIAWTADDVGNYTWKL